MDQTGLTRQEKYTEIAHYVIQGNAYVKWDAKNTTEQSK